MKLKILGSSSKGNCYSLRTKSGTLLLECGVGMNIMKQELHENLLNINACLITHEHKDHCKSIKEITRLGIDCYMSMGTLKTMEDIKTHRLMPIISGVQFNVADFKILPFDVQHDCAQPLGYLIYYRPTGEKLLFATDTYYIKNRFKGLNYIMIECNYINDTLDANIESGYINGSMKPRLLQSHFSLNHVKEFLKANDLSQCRKIILLHLSDGNSDSARMIKEIQELTGIETVVADSGMEIDLNLYEF